MHLFRLVGHRVDRFYKKRHGEIDAFSYDILTKRLTDRLVFDHRHHMIRRDGHHTRGCRVVVVLRKEIYARVELGLRHTLSHFRLLDEHLVGFCLRMVLECIEKLRQCMCAEYIGNTKGDK